MSFIEIEKSIRENEWSMQDLHSHPHYEIYYLSKGERSFLLSNALYKLNAPIVIVIPPHAMHKTEGGAFERYNINVAPSYLDPFQTEILQKKSLQIIRPNETEKNELNKLFEEFSKLDKRQKHAKYIQKTLFSYIVLQLNKLDEPTLPPSASEKTIVPALVLKAIDYLNVHYAEKITLNELADSFFVSKGTLIYNFKKYTNCSPIDFLLNVRLTKAKELLLNTKKSVGEISEACGFSSSNYFGLIFKQKEGLSPAHYRKHQHTKI